MEHVQVEQKMGLIFITDFNLKSSMLEISRLGVS